ncbi:MAG: hypothetical protein PHY83_00105 [Bacilli bacterium]|nr:hypothetical protein [Bacilli bacterium]
MIGIILKEYYPLDMVYEDFINLYNNENDNNDKLYLNTEREYFDNILQKLKENDFIQFNYFTNI